MADVTAPDGTSGTVPDEQLQAALRAGYTLRQPDVDELADQQANRAFVEGVARGATLGMSDPFLKGYGVNAKEIEARKEQNPVASTVGVFLPAVLFVAFMFRRSRAKTKVLDLRSSTNTALPLAEPAVPTDRLQPRRMLTRERLVFSAFIFALLWDRCSLKDDIRSAQLGASAMAYEYRVTKQALDECIDERDELEEKLSRQR